MKKQTDTIRAAIVGECKRRKLTAYALAALVEDTPSRANVNNYLAGRATMTTANASRLLSALDLAIDKHGQVWIPGPGDPEPLNY